jgi:hypothetical protein
MQAQVTQALRPAYEELASTLSAQPHLGIDESPTKEAAAKAWLWTFVAGMFTVFAVRGTRAATVLNELLTDTFAVCTFRKNLASEQALGAELSHLHCLQPEVSAGSPSPFSSMSASSTLSAEPSSPAQQEGFRGEERRQTLPTIWSRLVYYLPGYWPLKRLN